ncbi:hypothetical protein HYS30_01385 [Candidatus Peregrinibacteria bacterium]|nr:hypothetical protein [Candidatus Peregrinibacteria bacterium]
MPLLRPALAGRFFVHYSASMLAAFLSSSLLFARKTFAFGGPLPPGLPGPSTFEETIPFITGILQKALNLLSLAAVVVIIIAGIIMILSLGEEEKKEKAKKTILYAVIGLIIILLAKAIVSFVTSLG